MPFRKMMDELQSFVIGLLTIRLDYMNSREIAVRLHDESYDNTSFIQYFLF